MRGRRIFLSVLTVLVAMGCGKQASNVIKLGAILPLTGDTASYGKNAQSGIDLAVEGINAAAGNNGKKLQVIYEDDKGLASEAVKIIQKMITVDKVPVAMGSAGSSVTLAMAPVANRNKVVLISPISSSKELTTQGGEYFFRVCPSDAFQSRILAAWIWKLGLKTVGVIYVNNSWGNGLKEEFIAQYEKLGGKIVLVEASIEGQKDFRAQISKTLDKKPDALFAPTYGKEGGLLLKQAKELGLTIPIFGGDVWSSPELLESAGDAAEGVYLTLPAKFAGDKYQQFAAKYKRKFGKEPDIYAAYSYDMAKILAEAFVQGSMTGEELMKYLRTMPEYDGVTGKTKFDEHGDVVTKSFSKQRIVGGKYIEA
jgi:branched-chain amino acid transport system substrate-binding protein